MARLIVRRLFACRCCHDEGDLRWLSVHSHKTGGESRLLVMLWNLRVRLHGDPRDYL